MNLLSSLVGLCGHSEGGGLTLLSNSLLSGKELLLRTDDPSPPSEVRLGRLNVLLSDLLSVMIVSRKSCSSCRDFGENNSLLGLPSATLVLLLVLSDFGFVGFFSIRFKDLNFFISNSSRDSNKKRKVCLSSGFLERECLL